MSTLVAPQPAPALVGTQPAGRIASIDAVRGLTILVMIFVNDVAGVRGAPAWMKHIDPPGADGMTFVDVVFPAFLFIVGLSIPFALGRRLARDGAAATARHVLARTLGLLVIGVFMVNTESMSAAGGLLPPALWTLLMYAGVALVWCAPPPSVAGRRGLMRGLRAAGVVLLVALALVYRGGAGTGLVQMRPHWWGILGLIGWAYLVACAAYVLLRGSPTGLLGATALLYCVYAAGAAGAFDGWGGPFRWVDVGSMLGSHAALTVSGALLGAMLLPASPLKTHAARLRWALVFGLAMAAAALLLHAARDVHPMFIVNKIAATPAWCLYSAAITVGVWAAVYALLDVKGWGGWSGLLQAAGQNALLAYLLAPVFYAVFSLAAGALGVANPYAALGGSFAPGFARAVVFAFVVVWLAAVLRRRGFTLKL